MNTFVKMIKRELAAIVKKKLGKGKAIVVLGPRQVGKTTLLREICENNRTFLFLNGDDSNVQHQIENNCNRTQER